MLTDLKRCELRLKQDFLLMMAVDNMQFPESFRLSDSPGSPTLRALREYLYPDWEDTLDVKLHALADELKLALPNFNWLAQQPTK